MHGSMNIKFKNEDVGNGRIERIFDVEREGERMLEPGRRDKLPSGTQDL